MENLNFKTEDEKTIRKKEHSLFLAIAATAVAVIVLAIIGFISIKPAQQIVQGQVDGTNVRVSGLMPGRVEKFYVHEGQIVHKGDTLAKIESATVDAKLAQALAMRDAAEKAGKTLMVMRNNRFTDPSVYAKRFIDEGKMGDIYAGRCGWQRRRGIPGKGGWFTTKAQSGGGPLIDLGVHMIDLAIWLMGNPTPVAVTGATFNKFAGNDTSDSVNSQFGDAKANGTFDVEDLAMGAIRFDNGAILQIEFSWASNVKEECRFVELRGSKAGLKWLNGTSLEIYGEDQGQLTNLALAGQLHDNGHARNLAHFLDVLDGKAEPCFKPQQGINMIKILSAVYESAKTGHEVAL